MTGSEISIDCSGVELKGVLAVPETAVGLVIFSHGSGSSRFSPRNRYVSGILNHSGVATLLVDLLTPAEEEIDDNRFNIPLLTDRLIAVTDYFESAKHYRFTQIGYFGASTGAASALEASAIKRERITAIVSRGGRPDLAYDKLDKVVSPVLLIVGSLDEQVIVLNQRAYDSLKCVKSLEIVKGASHLFEEPGTLDRVAELACQWFLLYFNKKATAL